jgi:hypothetical protein
MSRAAVLGPLVLAALPLLVACDESGSPTRPADVLVERIQVEDVQVIVGATGGAATVSVHVKGVVGDGCSTLHSVRQDRNDGAVTVDIFRQRPKNAICTQIARLYDEIIPLDGQFAPGRYVLRVNELVTAFTIG